jgi:hypothetical protein
MAQKATRLTALEVIAPGGRLNMVREAVTHPTATPEPPCDPSLSIRTWSPVIALFEYGPVGNW